MTAFLLWPFAFAELVPRILHHTLNALTWKDTTTR